MANMSYCRFEKWATWAVAYDDAEHELRMQGIQVPDNPLRR